MRNIMYKLITGRSTCIMLYAVRTYAEFHNNETVKMKKKKKTFYSSGLVLKLKSYERNLSLFDVSARPFTTILLYGSGIGRASIKKHVFFSLLPLNFSLLHSSDWKKNFVVVCSLRSDFFFFFSCCWCCYFVFICASFACCWCRVILREKKKRKMKNPLDFSLLLRLGLGEFSVLFSFFLFRIHCSVWVTVRADPNWAMRLEIRL